MTELDEIRELNADEPRAGTAQLATARERLMATIAQEPKKLEPRRGHRKIRVATWTTGVAAAAAVTAFVVLVGTSSEPTSPTPAPSNAAYLLNEAADHTIHEKDQPLHPGQYRYVAHHEEGIAGRLGKNGRYDFAWQWEAATTTWIPYDETDIWTQETHRLGKPKILVGTPDENDKDSLTQFPEVGTRTARCGLLLVKNAADHPRCSSAIDHKQFNSAMAAAMPRDPRKLLTDQYLGTDASTAVNRADMLLSSGLVPGDLRAAIYRTLARVPGVKVTDSRATLDGRKGVAFGADSWGHEDIVIDPDTGQFLGAQLVADGEHGMPKGTVMYFSSMVTGVVEKAGEAPRH